MLLAVDVGNTNTGVGVFGGAELLAHFRVETRDARTGDEYALALHGYLALAGLAWPTLAKRFEGAAISTVVPATLFALGEMCRRHLGVDPLVVGPGIKTGMPILYEN